MRAKTTLPPPHPRAQSINLSKPPPIVRMLRGKCALSPHTHMCLPLGGSGGGGARLIYFPAKCSETRCVCVLSLCRMRRVLWQLFCARARLCFTYCLYTCAAALSPVQFGHHYNSIEHRSYAPTNQSVARCVPTPPINPDVIDFGFKNHAHTRTLCAAVARFRFA